MGPDGRQIFLTDRKETTCEAVTELISTLVLNLGKDMTRKIVIEKIELTGNLLL
jgi:hypothetical protein